MNAKLATAVVLLMGVSSRAFAATDQEMCLCKFVAPKYPPLARRILTGGGVVRVRVFFDSTGEPREVSALEGHMLLERYVVDAVKEWRFCPSLDKSKNHEMTVTFRFRLQGKGTDEWAPTEISFQSPATVDIITVPPAPLGPDVIRKDRR